jgi:hypothetical protein
MDLTKSCELATGLLRVDPTPLEVSYNERSLKLGDAKNIVHVSLSSVELRQSETNPKEYVHTFERSDTGPIRIPALTVRRKNIATGSSLALESFEIRVGGAEKTETFFRFPYGIMEVIYQPFDHGNGLTTLKLDFPSEFFDHMPLLEARFQNISLVVTATNSDNIDRITAAIETTFFEPEAHKAYLRSDGHNFLKYPVITFQSQEFKSIQSPVGDEAVSETVVYEGESTFSGAFRGFYIELPPSSNVDKIARVVMKVQTDAGTETFFDYDDTLLPIAGTRITSNILFIPSSRLFHRDLFSYSYKGSVEKCINMSPEGAKITFEVHMARTRSLAGSIRIHSMVNGLMVFRSGLAALWLSAPPPKNV